MILQKNQVEFGQTKYRLFSKEKYNSVQHYKCHQSLIL